jgi:rhodanese-related sulfurtransferase
MREPMIPVNLSPAELAALLEKGEAVLVDVREPAEFAAGHIAGAVLHPLSRFDPHALPQGRVVLSCGVGKRSARALALCAEAGVPHAEHLQGGLQAWMFAGLPVERS